VSDREPQPLRVAACEVAARLRQAGHEALFAGGCVRDEILGIDPVDYDIATSATPEVIRGVFRGARDVGEAFGVMLVRHGGRTFEVATFRKDGPYLDGRRPSSVEFSTAAEDAARRDFTINGIFMRPDSGEVVDYFDGRGDLGRRLVRAIGDPHARIEEDRLRMLRAVRFAARFGFDIEPATARAIRAHAVELKGVSPERIGEELRKMLSHPARARAAALAEELGLDRTIFGRTRATTAGGGLPRLRGLPEGADWTTALAAWALDRLASGSLDRNEVAEAAAEALVAGLRASVVLSNRESESIVATLCCRERVAEGFDGASRAAKMRLCAAPGFEAALAILATEVPPDAARWASEADALLPGRVLPHALLDGADLIAAGLKPGPRFKDLLDEAMDAQLDGRVHDKASALAWILRAARP
jgi:poly(A) polymerase